MPTLRLLQRFAGTNLLQRFAGTIFERHACKFSTALYAGRGFSWSVCFPFVHRQESLMH